MQTVLSRDDAPYLDPITEMAPPHPALAAIDPTPGIAAAANRTRRVTLRQLIHGVTVIGRPRSSFPFKLSGLPTSLTTANPRDTRVIESQKI